MPDERKIGDIQTIRSLMPLLFIGFTAVAIALLVLLWPNGQFGEQNVSTISHLERIKQPLIGETALSVPRRILDIAIYFVVIVGIGFLGVAWRSGTRNSLAGLIGISILGLSYVSGMALYTGPAVGTCGFLLILFAAMVGWLSLDSADDTDETIIEPDIRPNPADRTDNATLGTDDYGLHSVS